MTKNEKKKMCSGCRNDRYNMGVGFVERQGIDAPVTCEECRYLKEAQVVKRKRVSISQTPPWRQKATKVLSCYSVQGYVFIEPHVNC